MKQGTDGEIATLICKDKNHRAFIPTSADNFMLDEARQMYVEAVDETMKVEVKGNNERKLDIHSETTNSAGQKVTVASPFPNARMLHISGSELKDVNGKYVTLSLVNDIALQRPGKSDLKHPVKPADVSVDKSFVGLLKQKKEWCNGSVLVFENSK
jgi:hypothetical protein